MLQADVALEEILTCSEMLCLFVFVCIYSEPLNTSGVNRIKCATEGSCRSLVGMERFTAPLCCLHWKPLRRKLSLQADLMGDYIKTDAVIKLIVLLS